MTVTCQAGLLRIACLGREFKVDLAVFGVIRMRRSCRMGSLEEGYLDVRALVGVALLGPGVLIGLWIMPKLWRMEADIHREDATRWWPFGEALRAGFLRSIPVDVITCLFLEMGGIATLFEKSLTGEASHLARQLAGVFFIPALLGLFVAASIHLFNRPKFAVPPAARDELGAVVLWWSSRRYKKKGADSPPASPR